MLSFSYFDNSQITGPDLFAKNDYPVLSYCKLLTSFKFSNKQGQIWLLN